VSRLGAVFLAALLIVVSACERTEPPVVVRFSEVPLPDDFSLQGASARFIVGSAAMREYTPGSDAAHAVFVIDRSQTGSDAAGTLVEFGDPVLLWLAHDDRVLTYSSDAFYVVDPVAQTTERLPRLAGSMFPLRHDVSPDGTTLAYLTASVVRERVTNPLVLMDLSDGSSRELAPDVGSSGVAWIDDRQLLVIGTDLLGFDRVSVVRRVNARGEAEPFEVGVDVERFRLFDPAYDAQNDRWLFVADPRFADDGQHPRIVDHTGEMVWDDDRLMNVRCCDCGVCIGVTESGELIWRELRTGVERLAAMPLWSPVDPSEVRVQVTGADEAIIGTSNGVFSVTPSADGLVVMAIVER